MEKVSVIKCKSYQKEILKEAIGRSVELIGGFKRFISPADKILLKPNLLLAAPPEKAVTTHPVVLEAVIDLLSDYIEPSNISIADSPGAGIGYNPENLKKVYLETGILDIAQKTGCRLQFDTSYETVSIKDGKALKKVDIIRPALEAGKIINLCKFKTHSLTSMTGAVKNMFGLVPGLSKVGHHLRLTNIEAFSQMLIDIAYFKKPVLNIMDGVIGMEGKGPGMSGTPRDIGLVLASRDPLSMDVIVAGLMGLDRSTFPMLRLDGVPSADKVQVVGEIEKDYKVEDFVLPKSVGREQLVNNELINRIIIPRIKNLISPFPFQDIKKCSQCGVCREVCPQGAIRFKGNRVSIEYGRCTRCFCCSELCPEGAMDIRFKWLAGLLYNRPGNAAKK